MLALNRGNIKEGRSLTFFFLLRANVSERNERMKMEYKFAFSGTASHWGSPAVIVHLLHSASATFRPL